MRAWVELLRREASSQAYEDAGYNTFHRHHEPYADMNVDDYGMY